MQITYNDIRENELVIHMIDCAEETMKVMGYTEHSHVHAGRVSAAAARLMRDMGYSEREQELARITGYLHDIGNAINRQMHAQTGAAMAFSLLKDLGMPPQEIMTVTAAIGNHNEGEGYAVNPVSAAIILADKADVRTSRVRNTDVEHFDIHDRVNYAVRESKIEVLEEKKDIQLTLVIDDTISSVMDYLEIFMTRMNMCKRAAAFLGYRFKLVINGAVIL